MNEPNPDSPLWPQHLNTKCLTVPLMKAQILNVEFEVTRGLACAPFSRLPPTPYCSTTWVLELFMVAENAPATGPLPVLFL